MAFRVFLHLLGSSLTRLRFVSVLGLVSSLGVFILAVSIESPRRQAKQLLTAYTKDGIARAAAKVEETQGKAKEPAISMNSLPQQCLQLHQRKIDRHLRRANEKIARNERKLMRNIGKKERAELTEDHHVAVKADRKNLVTVQKATETALRALKTAGLRVPGEPGAKTQSEHYPEREGEKTKADSKSTCEPYKDAGNTAERRGRFSFHRSHTPGTGNNCGLYAFAPKISTLKETPRSVFADVMKYPENARATYAVSLGLDAAAQPFDLERFYDAVETHVVHVYSSDADRNLAPSMKEITATMGPDAAERYAEYRKHLKEGRTTEARGVLRALARRYVNTRSEKDTYMLLASEVQLFAIAFGLQVEFFTLDAVEDEQYRLCVLYQAQSEGSRILGHKDLHFEEARVSFE